MWRTLCFILQTAYDQHRGGADTSSSSACSRNSARTPAGLRAPVATASQGHCNPVSPPSASHSAPAVACVPLLEELRHGSLAWDQLLKRSPAASPFASWAWHWAWANAAPPDEVSASQAVLLRSADGAIEALLPVAVRSVTLRRRRVTALTWAIGDFGCPDHLDILASPEADLGAVVTALKSLSWDIVVLSNLAPDATNATRLAAALSHCGCAIRREALQSCPYLELPNSWEEYLAALSPTRRQSVRRKERNLFRNHAVVVTDYGPNRLEEGWRRLVRLHERRWGSGGAFSDPRVEQLHRCFAREVARRGQLWLSTLDLDGEPAAAWYGFAHRDTVYFYQSGRDPRWAAESVGFVLMAMMIRRAIERGYRRFDFLRGAEPYKMQWTASRRVTVELVAFRPNWRGQWLRGLDLAGRLRSRLLAHNHDERTRPDPASV